jgi:hypothetical protein
VIFKTVGILILGSQVHAKDLSTEDLFETPPESHIESQKRPLGISTNPKHHKMETTLLIKLPKANSFKETVPFNPYQAKIIIKNRYPNAEIITIISSKYK